MPLDLVAYYLRYVTASFFKMSLFSKRTFLYQARHRMQSFSEFSKIGPFFFNRRGESEACMFSAFTAGFSGERI